MIQMTPDPAKPSDGRKYHVGDKVNFTDDNGKQAPGIVHAVIYKSGRHELVGAQRPDMGKPEGPDNQPIPGTGEMQLVKGTENERHSFQYIMVHQAEHKAWHDTEESNNRHITDNDHHLVKPHPELKQHIRVFVDD